MSPRTSTMVFNDYNLFQIFFYFGCRSLNNGRWKFRVSDLYELFCQSMFVDWFSLLINNKSEKCLNCRPHIALKILARSKIDSNSMLLCLNTIIYTNWRCSQCSRNCKAASASTLVSERSSQVALNSNYNLQWSTSKSRVINLDFHNWLLMPWTSLHRQFLVK